MLNDGQSAKAGKYDFHKSHIFDLFKITRIEVIIDKDENKIMQMNFYHHQKRLVTVGDD